MARLVRCSACSKEVSSSASACPHCGQKRNPDVSAKQVVRVLGGVAVAVVAIIWIANANNTSTGPHAASFASGAETSQAAALNEPPMIVSPQQLHADYEANELAADNKYKGHMLSVTGTVERIGVDNLNEKTDVNISTGDDFATVDCQAAKGDPQAAALKKGTGVTVTGICEGKIISSIGLKDCRIQQ